jgi:CubicO group peptidase (beta-lactamase class C family)
VYNPVGRIVRNKGKHITHNKPVLWIVTLLLAALLAGPRPAAARPSTQEQPAGLTTPEELEAFLDGVAAAQLDGLHVAGMAVAVVKDGQLFFSKGYGYADVEEQRPVSPSETLFRAASVSKLFVWTAVMQLVEQGRLDLDADIQPYLDFELPNAFDRPVTLRHLMTHTPGFEDQGDGFFVRTPEEVRPLDEFLALNVPVQVFPPGEISAYSNYGAALAAYVVERETGLSFNEYVEANIFAPLGMADSTFRQPPPPGLAERLSTSYLYNGGRYQAGGFEYIPLYPAGSLSTTAEGIVPFMIAHLQNGSYQGARILAEDTARAMHALTFTHDPRLPGWGLGFMASRAEGLRTAGHGGDTVYFHSDLLLLLDQNVGIFVTTNTDTGALARSLLVLALLDRYYPEPPLTRPAAPLAVDLARYAGTYFPARMNVSDPEKVTYLFSPIVIAPEGDGGLAVSGLMGPGASHWVAIEEDVFAPILERDFPNRTVLVFRAAPGDEAGPIRYAYFSESVFIRQPWYAGQSFQYTLLGLAFLFFLGAVIGVPLGGLSRRGYERMAPGAIPPMPPAARVARWVAWLFSLLTIVYVVALVLLLSDINNVIFGLPPAAELLLYVPWLQLILAGTMVVFAILAWLRSFWTLAGRILFTLLTLFALGFMGFIIFWNLLTAP